MSVCVRDAGVGVAVRRIEITKKKKPRRHLRTFNYYYLTPNLSVIL